MIRVNQCFVYKTCQCEQLERAGFITTYAISAYYH